MDAVEDVKSRLSIEDVIAEYVQLKRSGRNFKGLSPFGSEKTASFMVSPEKQIWHDFSSGKGGNMFSFVMEVEGLDFRGALELLARKAGVDLEQYRSSSGRGGPDKKRLSELLDMSAKFYQVQFSKNKTALEYVLSKRKFSKETALEWRLGYSPNTGTALVDFAKSKGFSDQEIKQAGLGNDRYKQMKDMFRGRLMIPLQDQYGQVIGFTARLLEDDPNAPKYINTPQTVLYDKSRHIYGLHLAKKSLREKGYVVISEGNLDVIASHQAGVSQVVATAGTALTEPHLKTLSRFTGDIRLSFDGDKAGIAATERAIPIASRVKVSLSIIDIPSGKDPDDLIKEDPKLWIKAIDQKKYALDWLIHRNKQLLDLESAIGKREFSDVLLPVVRALADDVEKDHYLNEIAKLIGVSREALDQKFQKTTSESKPVIKRNIKVDPKQVSKQEAEDQNNQNHFLCLVLARKTLRDALDIITPEMFFTSNAKKMVTLLKDKPGLDSKNTNKFVAEIKKLDDPSDRVQTFENYVKILIALYEDEYQDLELNQLYEGVYQLRFNLIKKYVKTENEKIQSLMKVAGLRENESNELLKEVHHNNQLLNQAKGVARG